MDENIAERVASALHPPEYGGFYNTVNSEPQDSWIKVFCSDWNKDHWAFYAYIGVDSYQEDLKGINRLIERLNWRDGDVYVELINHEDDAKNIYDKFCDRGGWDHGAILNAEAWIEISEEIENEPPTF
ncbi:unnamed protein product, partial [marine sediment metagenome]